MTAANVYVVLFFFDSYSKVAYVDLLPQNCVIRSFLALADSTLEDDKHNMWVSVITLKLNIGALLSCAIYKPKVYYNVTLNFDISITVTNLGQIDFQRQPIILP